jgi:hypothetical protein
MKKIITLFCFVLICISGYGQDIEKIKLDVKDKWNLYLNDGQSDELFYLRLAPKNNPIGALVILPSGYEKVEDTLRQIDLHHKAVEHGLIVIVPSINWGNDDRIYEFKVLDKIFAQVIQEYNVPKEKFILGGLSNGGMISIKYAEKSVENPGQTLIKPLGVFGLDTPLDLAHLYEYAEREINRNFSEAGVNEAKWMIDKYNNMYGGSPSEFPEKYIEASMYSYGVDNGGNAVYLKDMPIRMYTDLDIDWLLNERHRDLYDWNGTNIVAMINELKLMGNKDANVVITMGKGVRLDGRRHPHSWSIMDTSDCMNWIKNLL